MNARDVARREWAVKQLVDSCCLNPEFEEDALGILDRHDAEHRAEVLNEAADAIVTENDRKLWASKPGRHWAADLLRAMASSPAAVPVPDETADVEPEFAVRWPDGELTRAADRASGLRAVESARRAEPGAVLVQRSCTPWTEVAR